MFFVVFIDLERQSLLPTYPKAGSKSCNSPQKLICWVGLILKFRKIFFRKIARPQGIEE